MAPTRRTFSCFTGRESGPLGLMRFGDNALSPLKVCMVRITPLITNGILSSGCGIDTWGLSKFLSNRACKHHEAGKEQLAPPFKNNQKIMAKP